MLPKAECSDGIVDKVIDIAVREVARHSAMSRLICSVRKSLPGRRRALVFHKDGRTRGWKNKHSFGFARYHKTTPSTLRSAVARAPISIPRRRARQPSQRSIVTGHF